MRRGDLDPLRGVRDRALSLDRVLLRFLLRSSSRGRSLARLESLSLDSLRAGALAAGDFERETVFLRPPRPRSEALDELDDDDPDDDESDELERDPEPELLRDELLSDELALLSLLLLAEPRRLRSRSRPRIAVFFSFSLSASAEPDRSLAIIESNSIQILTNL